MSEKSVGLVNFVVNTSYGSIYRFFPSKSFLDQLKNNDGTFGNRSPYYSNGYQEYNSLSYELLSKSNYFKPNYSLNVIGYINQASNFYMISRFLNRGLTFMLFNAPYRCKENELMYDIDLHMKILKRNAPNANIVFILRYPDSSDLKDESISICNKIKTLIQDKYPKCIDVLIHPMRYNVEYNKTLVLSNDIQNVVKYFYQDESKFVKFNESEQNSVHILLNDPVLKKKSIYTEKTIRAVCNAQEFDTSKFMDKLIQCGLFYRFPGDQTSKYFFKNDNTPNSIVPLLLELIKNSRYLMSKNTKLKYYLTSSQLRTFSSQIFKKGTPMGYRLLLKLLSSIKFGRSTLSGKKVYLRVYDYMDFGQYQSTNKPFRFIYS